MGSSFISVVVLSRDGNSRCSILKEPSLVKLPSLKDLCLNGNSIGSMEGIQYFLIESLRILVICMDNEILMQCPRGVG